MENKKANVESHDNGRLVYFNNVLVRSNDLNKLTNFSFWQKVADENPNFCPAQYHKNIKCEKCTCEKESETEKYKRYDIELASGNWKNVILKASL